MAKTKTPLTKEEIIEGLNSLELNEQIEVFQEEARILSVRKGNAKNEYEVLDKVKLTGQ